MEETKKLAEEMNRFFNRPRKASITSDGETIDFYVKPVKGDIQRKYSKLLEENQEDQDIAVAYLVSEVVCDANGNRVFEKPEDIAMTLEFKTKIVDVIMSRAVDLKMTDETRKNSQGSPSSEAVSQ